MAVSEGEGKGKGGVFDATVFVFDAVRSIKSTTVFVVFGKEMDLLSVATRDEVYAREERHARGRQVRERADDIDELGVFVRFCEFQTKVGAGG